MVQADRIPARDRDAFDCPRCGAFAHQEWSDLYREYHDDSGQSYVDEAWDTMAAEPVQKSTAGLSPLEVLSVINRDPHQGYWAQALCGRCNDFSTWRGKEMVYPPASLAPAPHPDMPPTIAELYKEAANVLGLSRRAGAALARATLEALLKLLDPDAGRVDLATRIDRIQPQVSSSLWKLLTVIRHGGNKSIHPEDEPDEITVLVLDPEDAQVVDVMFAAINDLVDEAITKPAAAAALYEKVPPGVRARVEREPN